MDFHDTLSAQMPSPRDDEPPTLRQDILDELGDHLACAYNRELLGGAGSNLARQRVLQRFGDPAAVARRLWLDAMKGKIMAQRVLIATCLVVILACTATVGLAWQWVNHDRLIRDRAATEAIEVNRRMSDALAQSQAANQAMLTQMREMTESVLHPVSPDWNPVILKLAEENVAGPPAAGFSLALTRLEGNAAGLGFGAGGAVFEELVTLSSANSARRQLRLILPPAIIAQGTVGQPPRRGGMAGTGGGMGGGMGGMGGGMGGIGAAGMGRTIYRISDSSGIADFGAVQPGDYRFQIRKNWDTGHCSASGQLNVAPGTKVEKLIVCPKTPPDRAHVRVRWSWPADLEKEQLVLYAPFTFRYRKLDPGLSWVMGDSAWPRRARRLVNQQMMMNQMMNQAQFGSAIRSVLCGPGTSLTEILDRKALFFWTFARFDENDQRVKDLSQGVSADILMENLRAVKLPSETPEPHELAWESGVYGLDRLIVLRPSRSPNVEAGRRSFDVLVGSSVVLGGPAVQIRGDSVRVSDGVLNRDGPPSKKDLETITPAFGRPGFGGMGGAGNNNNAGWLTWQEAVQTLELPSEFWDKVDIGFEARLGEVNEWTIPLPDELFKAVRAALKVDPAAKPKPAEPAVPANG
jgi:hypothetical protein